MKKKIRSVGLCGEGNKASGQVEVDGFLKIFFYVGPHHFFVQKSIFSFALRGILSIG